MIRKIFIKTFIQWTIISFALFIIHLTPAIVLASRDSNSQSYQSDTAWINQTLSRF
jgi:hypothetical protein